eukprot:956569-Rhodomonas_salina.2
MGSSLAGPFHQSDFTGSPAVNPSAYSLLSEVFVTNSSGASIVAVQPFPGLGALQRTKEQLSTCS